MNLTQYQVGAYYFDAESGTLAPHSSTGQTHNLATQRLEPKTAQVLDYLCRHPGDIVSKQRLFEHIWPDVSVSDDALLRCISALRKALSDNAKTPQYIQTVPKRGYQLICDVQLLEPPEQEAAIESSSAEQKTTQLRANAMALILLVACVGVAVIWGVARQLYPSSQTPDEYQTLMDRADNYYHQMRRTDNEMAIALYEQGMSLRPSDSSAQAGLANALIQKTFRWADYDSNDVAPSLSLALKNGVFARPEAKPAMERALALAEKAVRVSPKDVRARKALGFVYTAFGRLEDAMLQYQHALELEPLAWPVLINAGEIAGMQGDADAQRMFYERAFNAMEARYQQDIVQIRPWFADIGTLVGNKFEEAGNPETAEVWYRRVLSHAPLHESATLSLATLLARSGDVPQAQRLCTRLNDSTGTTHPCEYAADN